MNKLLTIGVAALGGALICSSASAYTAITDTTG